MQNDSFNEFFFSRVGQLQPYECTMNRRKKTVKVVGSALGKPSSQAVQRLKFAFGVFKNFIGYLSIGNNISLVYLFLYLSAFVFKRLSRFCGASKSIDVL